MIAENHNKPDQLSIPLEIQIKRHPVEFSECVSSSLILNVYTDN